MGEAAEKQDVAQEEMDAILTRLAVRPEMKKGDDPKQALKEFEYRGREWVIDPKAREEVKKGGKGTEERLLALTVEVAARMRGYEVAAQGVVDGKKRALERELKRVGEWEG